jgi:hypothetical protein
MLKATLFIVGMWLSYVSPNTCHSQIGTQQNITDLYVYKFKVAGVLTNADVKPLMDVIGGIFEKRPHFNEATQYFEISAGIDISEEELSIRMTKNGYTISDFTKTKNYITPNTTE